MAWHVRTATIALSLALSGLITATQLEARRENWDRTSQSARNLSHAVADDIGRMIESLDLSLQAVADNSRIPGVLAMDPRMRDLMLFDRAATASGIGHIALLDKQGGVSAFSVPNQTITYNFADRTYFRFHRETSDLGLRISGAFNSRFRDEPVFALSRRIPTPDGGFDGVVVGTIRLEALRTKFQAIQLGPHDSMSLFHENGTLIMRVPSADTPIGKDVSQTEVFRKVMQAGSGFFVARSGLDHVTRLNAVSHVPWAPLRLTVSLAVDDVESGWRRQAVWVGTGTLALLLLLFGLSHLLCRELRRRQEVEAALVESEGNFRLLAENSSDMVSRIGTDGVRRYVSPASVRLLGRTPEELVGRLPQEVIHPSDLKAMEAALAPLRRGEAEEATIAYRCGRADGAWVWLEAAVKVVYHPVTGQRDGVVAVARDISERKAFEEKLAQLASLDGLTGISNRRVFDECMEQEWRRCARAEMPVSLLLIDIDRFKALNDSQGHQKGDECLRQVAAALGEMVRRVGDLAARYGGEEFALLLPETDAMGAEAVAERVRAGVEALALPHRAGGLGGVVTVSIGAATIWPATAESAAHPHDLTEAADHCLYEAKRTGRNRVVHNMLLASPQTRRPMH